MLPVPIAGARWPRTGAGSYLYQRSSIHQHQGVDLPAPRGTPVWSVFPGVVETSAAPGTQGFDGYGRVIVVRRVDGVRAMYAHLDSALVDVGEHVAEGQQIATVGTSRGTAEKPALQFADSAAHLHFEASRRAYPLRRERDRIDPLGVNPMPDPEARTQNEPDDYARWDALHALFGRLYLAVPADRRAGEPDDLWRDWRAEYAQARAMGGDVSRARLTQWIARYNDARARLYQAGLRDLPPVARDRTTMEEVTDAITSGVIEPLASAASGVSTLLVLGALAWLYFESQRKQAR